MNNKKFAVARKRKDDEYYTLYADVKRECDKYLDYFKDKVIYSNCDFADSAFNQYFGELWKR